jgi:tRNA A-37 threonylcarbamoyl transferase component Bud32
MNSQSLQLIARRLASWSWAEPAFLALLPGALDLAVLAAEFEQGESASNDSSHAMRRCQIAGQVFYVKFYWYKPWQRGWRRSEAWTEWRNYDFFRHLGFAAPEVVAAGEERSVFGVRRAVIVTREIPQAADLRALLQKPLLAESAATRRQVLEQAAAFAATLHSQGFSHRDFRVRNILVGTAGPDAGRLFWIDCPNGRFFPAPMLAHHAATDLFNFLKGFPPELLAPADLDAFWQSYAGARTTPFQLAKTRAQIAARLARFWK